MAEDGEGERLRRAAVKLFLFRPCRFGAVPAPASCAPTALVARLRSPVLLRRDHRPVGCPLGAEAIDRRPSVHPKSLSWTYPPPSPDRALQPRAAAIRVSTSPLSVADWAQDSATIAE
jgi:hypothetical protein